MFLLPLVVDRANASTPKGGVNDKPWFLMQNVSTCRKWCHRQGGANDKGLGQRALQKAVYDYQIGVGEGEGK